jgi:hypothetical protein
MSIQMSDWMWAALTAAALLGIAALAVFGLQHGFEEGIGWFVFLLPGVWIAGPIVDAMRIANPAVANFIFRTLLFVFSFGWYFAICFIGLKIYRFVKRS